MLKLETINTNEWDSFRPEWLSDKRCHDCLTLFRNRPNDDAFCNVGNLALTSMRGRPHLFAGDQTFVLINWYARTNIERRLTGDGLHAWNDWAQATQATLILGSMPVARLPLSEILARVPTGDATERPHVLNEAKDMYEAYAAQLRCASGYERTSDGQLIEWHPLLVDGNAMKWTDLPSHQRRGWITAAKFKHIYSPVIVPPRASISVDITTDQKVLTIFRRY